MRRTVRDFNWQEGYGAFAVSMSDVEAAIGLHPQSSKAPQEADL